MIKFIISEYGTRNECNSFKEALTLLNFKPKGHFFLYIVADNKGEGMEWFDKNTREFDHHTMKLMSKNDKDVWYYEWDPHDNWWMDWRMDEPEKKLDYSLDDILDAIKYGFEYHRDAQNNGIDVPLGNKLQWLMGRKELVFVPNEFKKKQDESQ